MTKWNLIVARNMLQAKRDNDLAAYYYWKEMFI